MAIHRPEDDKPDIDTYATRDELIDMAIGIDTDENDNVFSALGKNEAARNRFLDRMLRLAFKDVNQWARHDFALHSAKTVVLDGNGEDALLLGDLGFWPLISVTSVTIDTSLVAAADYKTYLGETAVIERQQTSVWVPPLPKRGFSYGFFPSGRQNISIVMSWGYSEPPDEIKDAQCYAAISRCLTHLGTVTDPKAPGIPAGVSQVAEGSWRYVAAKGARYAAQAEQFKELAKELAFDHQRARTQYAKPQDDASFTL